MLFLKTIVRRLKNPSISVVSRDNEMDYNLILNLMEKPTRKWGSEVSENCQKLEITVC